MSELLLSLKQAGLSELACQFARFIQRLDKSNNDAVVQFSALLSEAVSQGHVCLNLAQISDSSLAGIPENLSERINQLRQSNVVGRPNDYTPLILTDAGLLYLYRHWQDEQLVATAIRQRCQAIEISNKELCQQEFNNWSTDIAIIDWQKIAVFMAVTRQFCVISGGPGTGKTTIVLRLLTLLFGQDPELKIAVVAPTGKAAARLQQAVTDTSQQKVEAKTLHRLLAITPDNEQGRYSKDRPLPIDVVIVDEASMIDISLMAKLIKSLPDTARLILLGDSQQLASVESGAVLANLCQQSMSFTDEFCTNLEAITNVKIDNQGEDHIVLTDSVVALQHSYRFDEHSDIGRLSIAVKQGDEQAVFNILASSDTDIWQQRLDPASIWKQVAAGYQAYFESITTANDALSCIRLFEQYRVLCALRHGLQSVTAINVLVEKQLRRQGWQSQHGFYHGRPIMVMQNSYRQNLFNGDTGLILRDEQNQLRACFLFDDDIRWVDIARLPAHETAYAMTIHKSQGSEFDNVCVVLPEEESPLLNRELLYTAITRAKKQLMLLSSEAILTKAVTTQHQRQSGLAGLLTINIE